MSVKCINGWQDGWIEIDETDDKGASSFCGLLSDPAPALPPWTLFLNALGSQHLLEVPGVLTPMGLDSPHYGVTMTKMPLQNGTFGPSRAGGTAQRPQTLNLMKLVSKSALLYILELVTGFPSEPRFPFLGSETGT